MPSAKKIAPTEPRASASVRRSQSLPDGARGAVLLEVVLALALFTAAAAVVATSFNASVNGLERLRLSAHAANLAISIFSELQMGLRSTDMAGPESFEAPFEVWSWQLETLAAADEFSDRLPLVEVMVKHEPSGFVYRLAQGLPPGDNQIPISWALFAGCGIWVLNQRGRKMRRAGFTLIEVALAIVITLGLLLVALFFYRQAAVLRADLLLHTERIATTRLVMDRITTELRSAVPSSMTAGLRGSSNAIEILTTQLPVLGEAAAALDEMILRPQSGLALVEYRLQAGANAAPGGLVRSERAFLRNSPGPASPATVELLMESSDPERLLTEEIRYFNVRYWDGTAWQTDWSRTVLPRGIELTLGPEPLPEDASPADGIEFFRRVIHVPASAAVSLENQAESRPAEEEAL